MAQPDPDAELNRVHPEQWVSFIVGDLVGIGTYAFCRRLTPSILVAALAYAGVYVAMHLMRRQREKRST